MVSIQFSITLFNFKDKIDLLKQINNDKQTIIITMTFIFSIEGNIGSGKSTLVGKLRDNYKDVTNCFSKNIIFMEEPVDIWVTIKDSAGENMIEKFYKDQTKYGFSFQMMAYISRLSMLKKCIKENPDSIIICERSINTDKNVFAKMLHDDGKIEDVEFEIYTRWFDEFISDIPTSGVIYVKTDPYISHSRVIKRGRKGEDIPLSYLVNCDLYHNVWLVNKENSNGNILVLDGDHDKTQDDYDVWIIQIEHFIYCGVYA